jgi:hypothetical protein
MYSKLSDVLRIEREFLDIDNNHQISVSPLLAFISFEWCFPPDYMHCVCLGVVRRLLYIWFDSAKKFRTPHRLRHCEKKSFDDHLTSIKLPSEFHRQPRSIEHLKRWKATEFRQFILYLAPVVMKNILPASQYDLMMALHVGTFILCSKTYSHVYDVAGKVLNRFVYDYDGIFGSSEITYNVHCLLHLSRFVLKFGNLDSWSAFPFENYLWHLKRRIRSPNKPLQQAVRQILSGALDLPCAVSDFKYTISHHNNFCLIAASTALQITEISQSGLLSGYLYNYHSALYTFPYDSAKLCCGFFINSLAYVTQIKPLIKCVPFHTSDPNTVILLPFVL